MGERSESTRMKRPVRLHEPDWICPAPHTGAPSPGQPGHMGIGGAASSWAGNHGSDQGRGSTRRSGAVMSSAVIILLDTS